MNKKKFILIAKNVIDLEIRALKNLKKNINKSFNEAVFQIANCQSKVVLCGVGKSGLIGKKISATLNSSGTSAIFIHAGEASHGDIGVVKSNDIFLAISKSGDTREITDLIPFLKNNGNFLIGMTSNRSSTLAKKSNLILFTPFTFAIASNNSGKAPSGVVNEFTFCPSNIISFVPLLFNLGIIYLSFVLIGGLYFLWKSIVLVLETTKKNAMSNFFASFIQLGLLLFACIIEGLINYI